MRMRVAKCPNEDLSLTNCVIVNELEFQKNVRYITVNADGKNYIFTIKADKAIKLNFLGFNDIHRKQALLSIDQEISVEPFIPDPPKHTISTIVFEVDFLQKESTTHDPFNTDHMAASFRELYMKHGFSVRQPLVFKFQDKKPLSLAVKEIEWMDPEAIAAGKKVDPKKIDFGILQPNSAIIFEKGEGSFVVLTGQAKVGFK